jgi:hypothetical protein
MAENKVGNEGVGEKQKISLLGAIFIGIGSMVGAGIFALVGEAGTIAGAAVWVSFLIGGIIALLQGYSLVTVAHLRMTNETRASKTILIVSLFTTSLAILLFCWYTLLTSPQTFAILVGTIILAWVVEAIWRWYSKREVEASRL